VRGSREQGAKLVFNPVANQAVETNVLIRAHCAPWKADKAVLGNAAQKFYDYSRPNKGNKGKLMKSSES